MAKSFDADPIPVLDPKFAVDLTFEQHGCLIRSLQHILGVEDVSEEWARRKSDMLELLKLSLPLRAHKDLLEGKTDPEELIWDLDMLYIDQMIKDFESSGRPLGKELAKLRKKRTRLTVYGVGEAIVRGLKTMVLRQSIPGHAMNVVVDESKSEVFVSESDPGKPSARLKDGALYDTILFAHSISDFSGLRDCGLFSVFSPSIAPQKWFDALSNTKPSIGCEIADCGSNCDPGRELITPSDRLPKVETNKLAGKDTQRLTFNKNDF